MMTVLTLDGSAGPHTAAVHPAGGRWRIWHKIVALPSLGVEIKTSPLVPDETAEPEALAQAAVSELRSARMISRASVRAFDWRALREIQRTEPDLATVCLTAEQSWHDTVLRGRPGPSPWNAGSDIHEHCGSVPRMVHDFGSPVWAPHFSDLTADALSEAHSLGLKVVVWTVNEVQDLRAMARLGVDGVVTDYPDRAVKLLAPQCGGERQAEGGGV